MSVYNITRPRRAVRNKTDANIEGHMCRARPLSTKAQINTSSMSEVNEMKNKEFTISAYRMSKPVSSRAMLLHI